jgi:hypothetical protein
MSKLFLIFLVSSVSFISGCSANPSAPIRTIVTVCEAPPPGTQNRICSDMPIETAKKLGYKTDEKGNPL